MRILRPNYRRSLLAIAALATLLAAGCATTGEASSDTAVEEAAVEEAAQQAANNTQAEAPKEPLRPTRAQLDALREGVFEQLTATDMAQGWNEVAGTDEAAVLLIAPFKTATRARLVVHTEAVRSQIESGLVNDSGADVMAPPSDELNQLFEGSEIPQPTPEHSPVVAELLERAYIIHGTLSETEKDTDTSDFTLTLRVLRSGHDGPLAEISDTITVTRPAALAGE